MWSAGVAVRHSASVMPSASIGSARVGAGSRARARRERGADNAVSFLLPTLSIRDADSRV